ncbi:hypothetical protein [Oceanobacillus alkalisoli]|uniref:hypothetical protein n=1 Tax=Oceanobacillus alkalisoli TaxID=2925113 RepID=UPI001F119D18|nr:hypothetical protein [Oceanobacillus alkalisoli]MCF3942231.1 hypothetical protein [Oceanobacillus alkalisoli]
MNMVGFIAIIIIAGLIGVQFGIYYVFRQKDISGLRSLMYSFFLYILPVIILLAHIEMYKSRHELVDYCKKQKINKSDLMSLEKIINTKRFVIFSFLFAVKDVITPKDNILLFIEIAKTHDSKLSFKTKQLFRTRGILGIVWQSLKALVEKFTNYAFDQYRTSRFKIKHV